MKTATKIFFFILILNLVLIPQEKYRFYENNINMPINNYGNLADVNIPPEGTLGRYNGIGFLFSGGFFMSGYNNNNLWANGVVSNSLVYDYQAGIVGSDFDDPKNIIYVVSSDDPAFGQSWQQWSDAVDLGADFYDGNGNGFYDPIDHNNNGQWDTDEDKPDIIGDLTAWCVYNDGIPAIQRQWESDPLGIEIHQTVFAYDESHPEFSNTKNTMFIRYRLINKGTVTDKLNSVYFSLFSDFDIGSNFDEDLAGCDTILNGSYGYKISSDPAFGDNPPAIFHHFVQLPHVYIPGETYEDNNGNGVFEPGIDRPIKTASYNRGDPLGLRIIPGAKNQDHLTSVFWLGSFSAEYVEPSNIFEARNYILGLTSSGNEVDPCTNPLFEVRGNVNCEDVNPYYWASGDPVTNQGWISDHPWDMRTVITVGPFDLSEGDYYDIIAAYTLGEGTDPLNSITVARQNVNYTRWCYNSNFGQFPVGVKNEEQIINDFQLYQNYPNPFNPTTTIKFSIPEKGSRSPLERGQRGVLTKLVVYDILGRKVTTLVNEEKKPGVYEVTFDASSLASGVYFYRIKANNYSSVKKMILLK